MSSSKSNKRDLLRQMSGNNRGRSDDDLTHKQSDEGKTGGEEGRGAAPDAGEQSAAETKTGQETGNPTTDPVAEQPADPQSLPPEQRPETAGTDPEQPAKGEQTQDQPNTSQEPQQAAQPPQEAPRPDQQQAQTPPQQPEGQQTAQESAKMTTAAPAVVMPFSIQPKEKKQPKAVTHQVITPEIYIPLLNEFDNIATHLDYSRTELIEEVMRNYVALVKQTNPEFAAAPKKGRGRSRR